MGKILVTGGNGFIGKHLVKYLENRGYDIEIPSSSELNVVDEKDWAKWKGKNIDHVIHMAGKTFVPDSWNYPEKFWEINAMGTLRAVSFCKEKRIGMTYISAYVYGIPESNPIAETAEVNPNNPYAFSKYIGEEICFFYGRCFDADVTVLRLFNVYGKNQSDRFLIPLVINKTLDETDSIIVQDLEPKRDYIYIDDVCRAIEFSINRTKGYNIFNVGSGESFSVREIINMVQKCAHTSKKVISCQNTRKNELTDVVADIGKIEKEWGWKPQVTMEKGIELCMGA